MRLQPPKNIKKYIGKPATIKNIKAYIGNHRVTHSGKEMTLDKYIEFLKEDGEHSFIREDIPIVLGLFPLELEEIARIYLEEKLQD
jgi:hypothetical protein